MADQESINRFRLLGANNQETAHNVACVLRFLAISYNLDGASLSDKEQFGRDLVLSTCAEALDTI